MSARRFWLSAVTTLAFGGGLVGSLSNDIARAATPAVVEDQVSLFATVESVDLATRAVLLRSPGGVLVTVKAAPAVRNLAQVRAGDQVAVDYYQAVAVQLAAPGAAPPPSRESEAYRAALGERPAAGAYEAIRLRVTILRIDRATSSVTFLDPGNRQHTVTVHAEPMRNFVRALKPGDQVDVDYVEELAVSIEPAGR